MSVFASQFSRARPYADAYVGDDTGGRFRVPAAVTAGVVAGAAGALLAGATVEAAERVVAAGDEAAPDGDGGDLGDAAAAGLSFDPTTLDDAALELPGLVLEQPYPGYVGGDPSVAAPLASGADGGPGMADAFPGLHTVSSVGEVGDISPAEAALIADGSPSWSHSNEMFDTTVGGDGGDFSYVMAGDTVVTFDSDGGAVYG